MTWRVYRIGLPPWAAERPGYQPGPYAVVVSFPTREEAAARAAEIQSTGRMAGYYQEADDIGDTNRVEDCESRGGQQ